MSGGAVRASKFGEGASMNPITFAFGGSRCGCHAVNGERRCVGESRSRQGRKEGRKEGRLTAGTQGRRRGAGDVEPRRSLDKSVNGPDRQFALRAGLPAPPRLPCVPAVNLLFSFSFQLRRRTNLR